MMPRIPEKVEANQDVLAIQGKKMEVNHLLNLPLIAESNGVKDWRGKFKDIPAIVIGAGPSLTEAIPHLKGLRHRALLIATDRSLKPLIEAGIEPHIAVSADMDPELALVYRGFALPPDLPLLYDRDAYHPVIEAWTGPRVTYDSYFESGLWSRMFTGAKGFLGKNGSVGHTALYFAAACGCSPVALVGVDCAFPGEWTHAAGVALVDGGKVDAADPKANWLEVPGVNGRPVRSSPGFARYAIAFGEIIHAQRLATINCSPIGAKIEGAFQMPLGQLAAEHLRKTYDLETLIGECLSAPREPFDYEAFERHCVHLLPGLERIEGLAEDGLRELARAHGIDHKRELRTFYRKLKQADRIREEMGFSNFLQMLMWKTLYRAIYLIDKLEGTVKGLKREDPKVLWNKAAKLEVLFKVERDAAQTWRDCLSRVRAKTCPISQ